ncbi:MAG: hypothetical protein DHS20C18_51210 [Saprospiraceae bacterium]|nr:MAG: hypothetical protein DHS20C18_51210 [Saprospiraceae bacterium]
MIVGIFIIALFAILWIGSLVGIFYASPLFQFFAPVQQPFLSTLGLINVLFVIGLILLSAVLFIARLVFGTRVSGAVRAGMMVLWIGNIVSLFAVASFIGRDFDTSADYVKNDSALLLTSDTLRLEIGEDAYRNAFFNIDNEVKFHDEKLIYRGVKINVEQSPTDQFRLLERRQGRGRNSSGAHDNADNILYEHNLNASTLTFDPNIILESGQPWRNQRLVFTIQVPKGKSITFGKDISRFLDDVQKAENDVYIWKNPGSTWRMEADGLMCQDCGHQKESLGSINLDAFHRLHVDGDFELEINQGDNYEMHFQGKQSNFDIVVLDSTLTLSPNGKASSIKAFLTTPRLESIISKELDELSIKGFEQKEMILTVSGRTRVKTFLKLDKLDLNQTGANEVVLRGDYENLVAILSDRARLEADKATVNIADITLSKDSKANLGQVEEVRKKVDVDSELKIIKE